jgi:hypothetical protein
MIKLILFSGILLPQPFAYFDTMEECIRVAENITHNPTIQAWCCDPRTIDECVEIGGSDERD